MTLLLKGKVTFSWKIELMQIKTVNGLNPGESMFVVG